MALLEDDARRGKARSKRSDIDLTVDGIARFGEIITAAGIKPD